MAEVDPRDTKGCKSTNWMARGTLASRGSRADHIVTTFEAKESGVPGLLAHILGISRRLESVEVLHILELFVNCLLPRDINVKIGS
jgi:hypothetical protein